MFYSKYVKYKQKVGCFSMKQKFLYQSEVRIKKQREHQDSKDTNENSKTKMPRLF